MRHSAKDRGVELYETPPEATLELTKREILPRRIWEPSAGRGAIVRVLRNLGHEVLSTDLHDHGSPDVDVTGVDFLRPLKVVPEVDAIVMNPPFSMAQQFVQRSMEYAPVCYALLRLAFLESDARHGWFRQIGLSTVHIFSNRLPMMHRDGWEGNKAKSNTAFAWFIFERSWHQRPTIEWIRWEPLADSN
jgi:methylase of polypeptide subunit release factors